MTWEAPASRYRPAFSGVTPPPTCRPPGKARSADNAASLRDRPGAVDDQVSWLLPACRQPSGLASGWQEARHAV